MAQVPLQIHQALGPFLVLVQVLRRQTQEEEEEEEEEVAVLQLLLLVAQVGVLACLVSRGLRLTARMSGLAVGLEQAAAPQAELEVVVRVSMNNVSHSGTKWRKIQRRST